LKTWAAGSREEGKGKESEENKRVRKTEERKEEKIKLSL
jgi:hypothetical protein